MNVSEVSETPGWKVIAESHPKIVNEVLMSMTKIFSPCTSVVTDPGIGIQRSDSLALFCGRKKIRIFKARIRIFVAR
jgi:hypothetical protein